MSKRIPCSSCGKEVLEVTAKYNEGMCAPCYRNRSKDLSRIEIATTAFAEEVLEKIKEEFLKDSEVRLEAEGGFGSDIEKQLEFCIWYLTRKDFTTKEEIGFNKRFKEALISACIESGFPEEQKERVYVHFDCDEALAKLMGRKKDFDDYLENKEK